MFKKALVCLDGSKLAEEILPYAAEACMLSENEIILLQVIATKITIPPPQSIHAFTLGRKFKPTPTTASDLEGDTTPEAQAGVQLKEIEREQGSAKEYLDRAARPYRIRGLKIRTLVLEGNAGETIVNYARTSGVSLIALTTHGSGGLKHTGLGQTAQFVLRESVLPVLIIKPGGPPEQP